MLSIATSAQVREMDRRAIAEVGIPGACLMQSAGEALARACAGRGRRVAILCGKGNNGGDGFVAARHLCSRGCDVTLFHAVPLEAYTGDAAIHAAPLPKLPIRLRPLEDARDLSGFDLLVDCLLGTGATGAPRGAIADAIAAMDASGVPTVACDIPSGVDADTGGVAGIAVRAVATVTFAALKPGLLLYPGAAHAGAVTVADIGIPAALRTDTGFALTETADIRALLPPRVQSRDANKGRFGKALVVAGSAGMVGAAVLTATAALRAGAGLVYLAVPESVVGAAAALAPEVVLRPLPETPEAPATVREWAEGVDAVAVGPGLGTSAWARELVRSLVAAAIKPTVIDADGLRALTDPPLRCEGPTVLTPHPGEMGRLLGIGAAAVQDDRLGAVRRCAALYGATALLKGARTLIAQPDGAATCNRTGSPALGTAGSGDTLTGVVVALLAGGLSPADAARAGAWLHAVAGELWEAQFGAVGALAGDLRDRLPAARRALYDPAHSVEEVQIL